MILKNKKFLITGILTDKSIAYASAKIAIENGATVVATGFGKGLRITERAVKRLSDDIKVQSMDIEDQSEQLELSTIKALFDVSLYIKSSKQWVGGDKTTLD